MINQAKKLFRTPGIISLFSAGILLGMMGNLLRAETPSDADLIFECVQTTYGQTQNGDKTIQFTSAESKEQSVLVTPKVTPAPAAKVQTSAKAKPAKETAAQKPQNLAHAQSKAPERKTQSAAPLSNPFSEGTQNSSSIVTQVNPVQAPKVAEVKSPIGNNSEQALDEDENETVGPFTIYRETEELKVITNRSIVLRTRYNLYRTAIVDPSVCDIIQFNPREISIIGRAVGSTHVTFWFEDGTFKPVTFTVNTMPDPSIRDRRAEQFKILENQIAKLFPNSKISLILLANKLILRGQARSAEEASEILRIVREDMDQNDNQYSNQAVYLDEETGLPNQKGLIVINQMRIPGVQTVALKVKLADLSRSGGSSSGVDFALSFDGDKILIQSLMGALTGGGGLISFNSADVKIGIDYLVTKGVVRQMSESTLVATSGTSATFTTGGEIPVPTITGVSGASAVTTGFRPYGTVINFTPTVMEKDLIYLDISSEFSSLGDERNEISGVPNLDSRTLNSQVQMREGQTFCLATILEDNYSANKASNVPIISDLIGHRSKSRGEREMVILVSPELVAPMEPDEVPPLPGFDVTEPTNFETHVMGRLEGNPTLDYRGTVWPNLRNRYLNGGSAIISGPYGH
ncbi:MAG: pilus assembly protein N-terminal domain-containing protein [Thermoguttaceae bacterium]|nr:pilus assembly protein N-terminal domain-containing protein [Thermoguttaceae bacterium]